MMFHNKTKNKIIKFIYNKKIKKIHSKSNNLTQILIIAQLIKFNNNNNKIKNKSTKIFKMKTEVYNKIKKV